MKMKIKNLLLMVLISACQQTLVVDGINTLVHPFEKRGFNLDVLKAGVGDHSFRVRVSRPPLRRHKLDPGEFLGHTVIEIPIPILVAG